MHETAALQILDYAGKFYPGLPFQTAMVLGSGLGKFPERYKDTPFVSYARLAGFPLSTAPGHEGKLYFLKLKDFGVLCFSGRKHYYEGEGMDAVIYPVRVIKKAGIQSLFLTNAAGGINKDYKAGDFMLVSDHINMLPNPLVGANQGDFGVRFPDMTVPYDENFRRLCKIEAAQLGLTLHEGVYIGVTGPSYETPAEIRAYRALGADAVGMSTVPEVIAARHAGIRVLAVTLIANAAAGMNENPLTEEEVITAGHAAAENFGDLVEKTLISMQNGKKSW